MEDRWARCQGSETAKPGPVMGEAECNRPRSQAVVVVWLFSHVRLFCSPMECSPIGSSVRGISQERILEWVAFPSPGDLPDPGM